MVVVTQGTSYPRSFMLSLAKRVRKKRRRRTRRRRGRRKRKKKKKKGDKKKIQQKQQTQQAEDQVKLKDGKEDGSNWLSVLIYLPLWVITPRYLPMHPSWEGTGNRCVTISNGGHSPLTPKGQNNSQPNGKGGGGGWTEVHIHPPSGDTVLFV